MINKYLNSYPHRPNTAPHRRRLTRLGLAVALLVTASNLAVTTAQAAPSPGADASQSIFVMTTNDESLVDGILTASKADPEYRRKATALSQTWISAAQAGHAPSLGDLSALPAAQQITRLGQLKSSLVKQSTVSAAMSSKALSATTAASSPSLVSAMNIGNGNNPNSFPVKGSPAGDRSYWTGMTLYVSGTFCGPSGCRMTDKFTTYLTITPSAATSMVCWTKSIYLPNGGNFGNKHLYLWPINSSIIIGGTNTGDISTPSCKYVANTIMVNNDVLTIAVTLWVYGIPNGGYQPDGAKTANARCRPPGNNRCYY